MLTNILEYYLLRNYEFITKNISQGIWISLHFMRDPSNLTTEICNDLSQ